MLYDFLMRRACIEHDSYRKTGCSYLWKLYHEQEALSFCIWLPFLWNGYQPRPHLAVLPLCIWLSFLFASGCPSSLHLVVLPLCIWLSFQLASGCPSSLHLVVLPPYIWLSFHLVSGCPSSLHLVVLPPSIHLAVNVRQFSVSLKSNVLAGIKSKNASPACGACW